MKPTKFAQAIFGLFVLLLTRNSSALAGQSDMPPVCKNNFGISDTKMQKLAEIAFEEAQRKHVSLKQYNSVFAVVWPDLVDENNQVIKKGGYYAVRFSPFRCNSMGTDGGGFDVDIDPGSFKVISSRISFL